MRVLVVDDNLLMRSLLCEMLTDAGHSVVGRAENGADALAQYEALRPDVVTLDLVMPGEHGLAVLFDIKRLDPQSVVIVCSAHLTERRVLTAIDLGASGFISKPFDRKRVLDALEAATSNEEPAAGPRPELPFRRDEQDRRQFERVRASLPVILIPADSAPLRTVTIDLSGNGMSVGDLSLQIGQKVRFSLRLAQYDKPVCGWARVVRTVPGERQGLTIEELSAADHERMIDFIRSRQGRSGRVGQYLPLL